MSEIKSKYNLFIQIEHGQDEQTQRSAKDGQNNERVREAEHENEHDRRDE